MGSRRSEEDVKVDRELAGAWGEEVLRALGAQASSASETIDHLLAAEDTGHPSHGLRMLVSMTEAVQQGRLDPAAMPIVEMTSGAVARIDGRRGLGPPIGRFATDEAVRLAQIHGASAVAVRSAGHMGRLAPYAEAAAACRCAMFICANDGGANQHVVPAGGVQGRLSTNPIAFGFPRAVPPHLVVDMATSTYAHGTLRALGDAGRPVPDDALLAGASGLILPMAGYKGFALGLIVEAFAGALTGAGVVSDDPPPESQGALMLAVDVTAIGSLETATQDLEMAIAWVRSASAAGAPPIRIPGENRVAGADGEMAIARGLWSRLVELSDRLNVRPPPSRLTSG